MAMIDTHSKSLKNFEKAFDEHDDMIRNIVKYTGEKFEDFEMNANRIKENNISLDNKIEAKLRKIEEKILDDGDKFEGYHLETLRLKTEIQKLVFFFSLLPFLGVFFLYFWITLTLPTRISIETKPSVDLLQFNIENLRKGIESKVANLESDTVSEFLKSQKALSSMDQNLEQRFEAFIKKFQRDLSSYEVQLLNFEKSYKNEVVQLNEGVNKQLSEIKHETWDKISEASSRMNEFMIPKLWLSRVKTKVRRIKRWSCQHVLI